MYTFPFHPQGGSIRRHIQHGRFFGIVWDPVALVTYAVAFDS